LLDTSGTTAPATSPVITEPDSPVPTELLAAVLTDDQRALARTTEGLEEVASQVVTLMGEPQHWGTDLAKAIWRTGGDARVWCSAVREGLRALNRKPVAVATV